METPNRHTKQPNRATHISPARHCKPLKNGDRLRHVSAFSPPQGFPYWPAPVSLFQPHCFAHLPVHLGEPGCNTRHHLPACWTNDRLESPATNAPCRASIVPQCPRCARPGPRNWKRHATPLPTKRGIPTKRGVPSGEPPRSTRRKSPLVHPPAHLSPKGPSIDERGQRRKIREGQPELAGKPGRMKLVSTVPVGMRITTLRVIVPSHVH
jgi:hypothetical protein